MTDAINARLGWPQTRREPCHGHMRPRHDLVDGIDITSTGGRVEFWIAHILAGVATPRRGTGNTCVRCLLPHPPPLQIRT